MALSPSEISGLLATAQQLKRRGRKAEGFILAWTGWEAYKHRALSIGLQFQGISQKDAASLLAECNSGNEKNFDPLTKLLFLRPPQQAAGIGHLWQRLENSTSGRSYRRRRNDLVHGSKSADPRVLGEGVDLICSYVVDEPLLFTLVVPIRFGDARGGELVLGDVLSTRAGSRGSRCGTGPFEAIHAWLSESR